MNEEMNPEQTIERSGYGMGFIQSIIFGLATFFACAALFVDILIHQPLHTWGIVLFLSSIYFILGFTVKYLPTLTRYCTIAFSAYSIIFLFMKIEDRSGFYTSQFNCVLFFILSASCVFWFFSRPQNKQFNQDINSSESDLKTSTYSKLKRRMSRRKGKNSHLSTKLKMKGK